MSTYKCINCGKQHELDVGTPVASIPPKWAVLYSILSHSGPSFSLQFMLCPDCANTCFPETLKNDEKIKVVMGILDKALLKIEDGRG